MAEPGSLIAEVLNRLFVIQQLEDIEKWLHQDVDNKREGGGAGTADLAAELARRVGATINPGVTTPSVSASVPDRPQTEASPRTTPASNGQGQP